ncbi:unnamed protein product [Caenorhabditis sp. 36 PRJEB53466]|nr:unnamed protein product [Caenorhabditis sp. 36 PRJEB53466]
MTSMRIGGIKQKLSKISVTPSRDRRSPDPGEQPTSKSAPASPGAKQKKESYKKKIMRKYNMDEKEYEEARKTAQKQMKDWEEHKKDQVLEIYKTKSTYVSKSAKSDVMHPKMSHSTKVLNRFGKTIDVEFGKMKEYYLFDLKPNKQFVEIRAVAAHDQQLDPLRAKQKAMVANNEKKQADKTKYDQMKSIYGRPEEEKTGQEEPDEKEEETPEPEKYKANTTDEKRNVFPEAWYQLSMSRTQMEKGRKTYWVATGSCEESSFDDDPEGKFTVTAEKLIETLEAGGKVKDSGVVEPKKNAAKKVMTDGLAEMLARYNKTCGRDICFTNTLKGTIEFSGKAFVSAPAAEKTAQNSIQQEPPTESANEITFTPTIIAHVFKGTRLRRQYAKKNKVEKYVEERKNYTREAGEDTSGGL